MSESGISKVLSRSGFALISLALLATTLVSVSSSASASAKTYFVSASGNDNNAGTQQAPFKTIAKAITTADTGHTIEVLSGSYVENLTIDKALTIRCANAGISAGAVPGTRGTETVIQGEATVSAADVVIDGCKFIRPDVNRLTITPKLIRSSAVTGEITVKNSILDMQLFNAASTTTACGSAIHGTAGWRIYSSTFLNQFYSLGSCTDAYNSRVIYAQDAQPITVDGNLFQQVGHAIYMTTGSAGTTTTGIISNNKFSGTNATILSGRTEDLVIRGNTFANTFSIYFEGPTKDAKIENNLFTSSNQFALSAYGAHSGTIMRNNAILGVVPSGEFGGKTLFNNGINGTNPATSPLIDARQNFWGNRDATTLIVVTEDGAWDVSNPLLFEGTIDQNSAIGFFPSASSGDGSLDLTASHTVSFTVATTRSISVEPISEGSSTTVAFGGVPQTGTRTITQVRLKFTADDAINQNSRVRIRANLNTNTATGVALKVTAGNLAVNGDYVAVPIAAVDLDADVSQKDIITSIYGSSGVTDATSDLSYSLVTSGALTDVAQTRTVTYTLSDD